MVFYKYTPLSLSEKFASFNGLFWLSKRSTYLLFVIEEIMDRCGEDLLNGERICLCVSSFCPIFDPLLFTGFLINWFILWPHLCPFY